MSACYHTAPCWPFVPAPFHPLLHWHACHHPAPCWPFVSAPVGHSCPPPQPQLNMSLTNLDPRWHCERAYTHKAAGGRSAPIWAAGGRLGLGGWCLQRTAVRTVPAMQHWYERSNFHHIPLLIQPHSAGWSSSSWTPPPSSSATTTTAGRRKMTRTRTSAGGCAPVRLVFVGDCEPTRRALLCKEGVMVEVRASAGGCAPVRRCRPVWEAVSLQGGPSAAYRRGGGGEGASSGCAPR